MLIYIFFYNFQLLPCTLVMMLYLGAFGRVLYVRSLDNVFFYSGDSLYYHKVY